MNWYFEVLKKYADFNGRASRSEFWYFTLFSAIVSIFALIIDFVTGTMINHSIGILEMLYGLAVFLPTLGVYVRRLHDTNRSGWWILISLIPLVGSIVLIVFLVQDSQPGENKYGQNPKILTSVSPQRQYTSNIHPGPTGKFCPQCGQNVAINDKFCENCGHSFL